MAPPQAIPILGQMKDTSVQAPYLWSSGGCHIWHFLTLIMVQGITNCGCIFSPQHLFEFDLNNDPSPGNSSLGSDGSTSVHLNLWFLKIIIIHLMSAISGPRIDFYNCPWDNLNNSHILTYRHLFLSNSNDSPSPGLCNLGQIKDTPCSGLPLMVSWWVQYWPSAPSLTSIMAQRIT